MFVDPHMDDPELIVVNVRVSFLVVVVVLLLLLLLSWTTLIWPKVRMFKNIDVDKLELWKYDGFNRLQPGYEV